MARWARDSNNVRAVKDKWIALTQEDKPFEFKEDDTIYVIRGVSNEDSRYIVDAYSPYDRDTDTKVRYILKKDLTISEIKYILYSQRYEPRCPGCQGIDRTFCYSSKVDVCLDCGLELI